MNRPKVSRALTIVFMAAILGAFVYQRHATPPQTQLPNSESSSAAPDRPGDGPESVVWRMVDASRAGDLAHYLECYAGELEPRLRRDFQEMGPARSREYLLESYRQLKGVAVGSPRINPPLEVQVPVEYVYEDRNEIQQYYVKRIGGLWKIDRVEGAKRLTTVVPYGTPVEN